MYYECGPILRQRSKAHIPQCCVRTRGNYFCYYYYFTPYLVVHCWMLFLWPAVYHFKKLILRNKRSIKEDYTSTSNLCVRCFRVWRNLLTLVFDLRKLILMLFVRTFSKKKKIKWHFISYFASRELFTIIWPQIGELFRININVFSCF